ncbi:pyridoxal 5'-phosphate synthase glutaminase subunit PdxT [Ursidibacter arcticus]
MQNYRHLTIGVLALQGAVSEHCQQIEQLGATAKIVKNPSDLTALDGLVLPGGESTAIGKLMRTVGLLEAIQQFAQQGKGLFGTCAGMILLAKQIEGGEPAHLGVMDICVQRNAFGRQIDSFQTDLAIKGLEKPFPAVFIRAPYISTIENSRVEVLAEFDGNVVLAKQGKVLVCSFHPELTNDARIMQYFLEIIAS